MPGKVSKQDALEMLKNLPDRPLTAAEIREQQISFAMGSLGKGHSVTREEVEAVLDRMTGRRTDKK